MSPRTSDPRRVTLATVAAATGVSTSTVSRVFSHPHRLRAQTVERVRAAATELGYVPHSAARALSTGRLGAVAVVVPDIANTFFPPVVRAAQVHAQESGVSTLLGNTDEDPSKELDLVNKLQEVTDGVLLVSSRLSDDVIRERAGQHPLVLINRDTEGVPRALLHSAPGARDAVRHLVDLGHRHLVYLSGPETSWSNSERRRAVLGEAEARGVRLDVLGPCRPDHEAGRAAALEVLRCGASGVLAFDDTMALGVLAGLAEAGASVPADVSVVGCDDIDAERSHPPLTSVHGQSAEVGRRAVELLFTEIETRRRERGRSEVGRAAESEEVRVELVSSLVVRASTGRAPSSG